MSDNPISNEGLVTSESTVDTTQSAGQLLKAARLKAGVHLAVLSVTLKIPVRQLEALEADQYLLDQSPVFVRGLASSVCRQLRIDPVPILALLPHGGTYLEPHGVVRQAHVRPTDFGHLQSSSPRIPARAWWAATSMSVMIAALIWLPSPTQWAWLNELAVHFTTSTPEVRTVTSEPDVQPSISGADAAPLGAVTVVPSVTAVPATSTPGAAVVEASGAVAKTASGVNGAPLPTSSAAGGLSPQLQFTATDTSWIEVRDARQQVIWSGVLKAGEMNRIATPEIVHVVVGRAEVIQVTFKGQILDLKPYTKVNVARFEVKP